MCRKILLSSGSYSKINPDLWNIIREVIKNFEADCDEMEGASIAHGAYLNGIPFVIIRAISDKADGSAEQDYPTFEKAAAAHCAKLVADMLTLI